MMDVTVVLLDDGLSSTAVMPVEIFHSAGALWNLLHAGGKEYPRLSPETEAELRNLLRPEIEELEPLLGRDLSAWKLPLTERNELRRAGAGK